MIVETAHPVKFSDAVKKATGITPELPASVSNSLKNEESYQSIDASIDAVQSAIDSFIA